MEVLGEEDVNQLEAKRIIEERKKVGDLVYEQKICAEYLDKVTKDFNADDAAIVDELQKISILRPRHIALIINNMPDTEEEVQALFSREIVNLKKEEIKQITDIINKNRK